MPIHRLSDVDVVAISIVNKGANRKRIYLKKNEDDNTVFDLPAEHRIVKANGDWTVFYAVVAEPGALEGPGQGADQSIDDIWESEEEIRKAAHKFMKNGALVNRMHESLAPYGTIVENFIAQTDFQVGNETIKKGSWVVGIEPTDTARHMIDSGEFTGISIQGTGTRTLAKKDSGHRGASKKCPKCNGTVAADRKSCQNCSHSFSKASGTAAGPVRNLVAHYMKKKHPFRACVRDNTKRFGKERAERVCAKLKDIGHGGDTSWRRGRQGVAKAEAIPEEFYVACEDNWYGSGLTDQDATIALEMALDADDRSLLTKIADKLGISTSEEFDEHDDTTEEEDVALTDEQTAALAKVDGLEKTVTDLTKDDGRLAGIEAQLAQIAERLPAKDDQKSDDEKRQELEDTVTKLSEDLSKAQQDLEKLAQGDSSQSQDNKDDLEKNDPDTALAVSLFG